ncbi:MAG: DUF4397 domain-containing protein, partial [Myxococcales bacterium]|nr:DUF4397 domain-containing protein [Myxococcales bacterium]
MQRWNTMLLIAALTSLGAVGCDDETNTTNTDGGQDASTNDGNVDVDGDVNDGGTEDATVDAGPTAASLRVVHAYAYANIEIDVYLSPQGSDIPENAAPLAEDVAYGDVYANDGLAPGAYTLHFFQAGSDPSEEQAATYDVTLVAGELNTVVAALAAPGEPPAFLELGDVSAPTAGNASVVFVNALAGDESFTAYDLATIETPVELFMDFEFGDQEAAS